ncbi:chromosome segregation protein (Spc7 kinetochore protein) [Colletotrichum truncatum]|uniref:Chromosome segregation protein (Spc7 kinetochore protein) n=1 Tax=Colletotrichum truncatum TaxID=5467 RepID=A0ACC3YUJ6_COLTU|nr:chromosome segregation protein (Spc7 kinetochore protein) [Colletotrichum truncatum]KAF6798323.1 chromosome segregation protein (Spc7 kinetochore protein) [Colletotrichum truncatum]
MASFGDATMPSTRRTRKSIGAPTSSRKVSDKENATIDVGSTLAESRKKSRSKSIGPGGLDALKNANGNRRASLAVPSRPPPRSILKPTVPLLPEIPPHRKRTADLIDLGPPRSSTPTNTSIASDVVGSGSKIALRTEEEQQAAAREREERERRDARRKSLANRRVSFAAEATLHTFHEIEYMQDSTSSTDSTRRASRANDQGSDRPSTPQEQPEEIVPQSPENQRELHQKKRRRSSTANLMEFTDHDDNTAASGFSSDSEPADAVEEVDEDEEVESDSNSDSDDEGTMMTIDEHEVTGASVMSGRTVASDDENDTLDEALRMAARQAGTQRLGSDDEEEEEEVIPSFGWIKKSKPQYGSSEDQENEPLPPPVRKSPLEDEDDGDMDMDMDITNVVGGILNDKTSQSVADPNEDMTMDVTRAIGGILSQVNKQQFTSASQDDQTMEFTTAVGGIQQPNPNNTLFDENDDEDMSMEFTTAIGGLLPSQAKRDRTQKRRRTVNAREDSVMEESTMDMDMTVGVGKILPVGDKTIHGEDATMGMDMTVGIGNILSSPDKPMEEDDVTGGMEMTIGVGKILGAGADSPERDEVTMGMDMTMGVGRILSNTQAPDAEDATMGMDMTMAVGGILRAPQSPEARMAAKKLMEEEVDKPDTPSKGMSTKPQSPAKKLAASVKKHSPAKSDTGGSPAFNPFQGRSLRNSMPRADIFSESPARSTRTPSPPKSTAPPPVVSTPLDSSPVKTPQSTKKRGRPKSPPKSPPKSTPKSPVRKLATPSSEKTGNRLNVFQQDPTTGARTPTVVLTPQPRRHSGVGADKPGLGSPRVAAILDRRGSLGEAAQEFVPGKARGITFADPKVIEYEIDQDRQEEEDKENGRRIMEREADGENEKDATLNLREMIDSLSPKKKRLQGRKSLHVGSAKGLLGKRPAELDDEVDGEDNDGVKRLKGHQGSPVKNVKLQQPPSKAETTGRRLTRSSQRFMEESSTPKATPTHSESPLKSGSTAKSPHGQGRFRDVADDTVSHTMNLDGSPARDDAELMNEQPEERIHLQDFLNMTSIRFMELTTTKRRHTQAPDMFKDMGGKEDMSLERCVIAGACTVPMLELYQHSCRELKKYISEGRRIVREIESETFEENPPLFREYMSASADFKNILDNQFKNGKTHARLESKAMWYEWRMKLQEGLREGLVRIAEGMDSDEKLLAQQQKLLSSVLPGIVSRFAELEQEHGNLKAAADELADCDPEELEIARSDLAEVERDVQEKTQRIAELRQELEDAERGIEALTQEKQQCYEDIKEAEKIREECRGWSTSEISALKDRVDALEKQHGWAVTGVSGSQISMTYRREIELVFDITSFQPRKKNSRIDLWYIAANRENHPVPSTPEKEFFLQCIRDHVRALQQSRTKIADLLHMVRTAWDKANSTSTHVRQLNITFPTTVNRTSDSSVAVKSSLLLAPLETKVEIALEIQGVSKPDGVEFSLHPEATVVYGEHFNTGKIAEFLLTHLGDNAFSQDEGTPSWSDVVVNLHERLLARGRKQ